MSVDCIMTLSNDFMSSSSNVVTLERKVEESSIFREDIEKAQVKESMKAQMKEVINCCNSFARI